MQKIFYLVVAVLFALNTQAQGKEERKANPDEGQMIVKDASVHNEDKAYSLSQVDTEPEFPGGKNAFRKYVLSNVVLPDSPTDSTLVVRCYINFIVEKDGSVSSVKINRNPGYGLGEIVAKAVAKSPKWKPGLTNGNPVRTAYTLPVTLTMLSAPAGEENARNLYDAEIIDVQPVYEGGEKALNKLINEKINKNNFADVKAGKYIYPVKFIVGTDGSVSSIDIRGENYHLEKEIARVLVNEVKYTPGQRKGKIVRTIVPVSIEVTIK